MEKERAAPGESAEPLERAAIAERPSGLSTVIARCPRRATGPLGAALDLLAQP